MTPEQAEGLKSEFEAIDRQARALTAGMDSSAFTKTPSSGGWSVAQNLQHLILTAEAMLPLLEAAIGGLESGGRKSTRPSRLGLLGWLLVKSLEPPARMKMRTSPPFEPLRVDEPLTLPARLQEANTRLAALIPRATGLDTGATSVVSPFNAKVSYNLYAALRIVLAHTRRHLFQAGQAKAAS